MSSVRKLFGQTALYGLSSILGRFLNFLLVPLHTFYLDRTGFGVVTDLYVLVAFLLVLGTYGMETAFFKFYRERQEDSNRLFATAMKSILATTALMGLLYVLSHNRLEVWLRYEDHPEYLLWLLLILFMDVIAALPFARLRVENRVGRFVTVKMVLVGVNVLLNFWYFWAAPGFSSWLGTELPRFIYTPGLGPGYVLLANLWASAVMLLMLLPAFRGLSAPFDRGLWKQLIAYGWPLMLGGMAGIANEMVDRQLLKYLLPEDTSMAQVGIYGAVYKLSIFMVLFIQAFRYAAEPFFFNHARAEEDRGLYGRVMHYFVLVQSFIYLGLVAFSDVVKRFIDEKFWEGMHVFPILLLANFILGISFNLSIWYKLSGQTRFGAWISFFGLFFTLGLNIWWIPVYGYTGAAWATLVSYTAMMLLSYYLGQKHYPISYPLKQVGLSFGVSLLLAGVAWYVSEMWFSLLAVTAFALWTAQREKTLLQKLIWRK